MKRLFAIGTIAVCCAVNAVMPDPASFTPDFSTTDIYLPHLKRTHLSGWWKYQKTTSNRKDDPNDTGTKAQFQRADFDDSNWQPELIPNNMLTPIMMELPKVVDWGAMHRALKPAVREWGGVIWFRRNFDFAGPGKGERAILTFEEIRGDIQLYINGELAVKYNWIPHAANHGPKPPIRFDITKFVKKGKNNITIRLFNPGLPVNWGWGQCGGLTGLIYLDIRPEAYAPIILATTDKNLKDVSFECIQEGSSRPADTDNWTGEIFEWNSGKKVAAIKFGKSCTEDGLRIARGTVHLKNPKLWSCESPFLYGIRVRNARRELTGIQRFGVRTFTSTKGNFLLNGKPVFLRGLCHDYTAWFTKVLHGYHYFWHTNPYDKLRKFFVDYLKAGNVNHVRTHSSTLPHLWYDIFDELGILIADELHYPEFALKDGKIAEMISVKGFDGACDKTGKLHPQFIQMMKDRIRNSYSHPTIVMYSFGNEIRQYDDPKVGIMLNNLNDLFHSVDKQGRPVTNSSGRFWKDASNIKLMHDTERFDYIDTHDYSGSIDPTPISGCEAVAEHFIREVDHYYGDKAMPIMNGETCGGAHFYYPPIDKAWRNESDPEPQWKDYLYMLGQWQKDFGSTFLVLYWAHHCGVKWYKYHRWEMLGTYVELNLEPYRKLWPKYDGYESIADPFYTQVNAWPYDKMDIKMNVAHKKMSEIHAPVLPIFEFFSPNRFTGEKLTVSCRAINNSEKDLQKAGFTVEIFRNGKSVWRKSTDLELLKTAENRKFTFVIEMPEEPGEYRLEYRITNNGTKVSQRDKKLFVLNRKDLFKPFKTNKKIALYDASGIFGELKPYSTLLMLNKYSLPFTELKDFKDLGKYDLLIIGADSIDAKVMDNAEEIRKFVENGKRMLVFEQSFTGRIPFLPELEYMITGPAHFSEITRTTHPVLKGLKQDNFFGWQQRDRSIYRQLVAPLSHASLLTGSDRTYWGAGKFGSAASHIKLGKGDIFFNQTEVAKTAAVDSGAAKYARQLIECMLDDATRKEARTFIALPVLHTKPLNKANAVFISLRDAANMGFKDDIAEDGKGGWSDQGPKIDMSPLPTGYKVFGFVPFRIIDPATNGGRSCVVQSANKHRKLYRPVSKPVVVNQKLKRLLFLHSGAWLDDDKLCGEYAVTYKSGKKVSIPIVCCDNINDWCRPTRFVKNCDVVWTAQNGRDVIGIYLYEWKNPNPEDEIRDIVLKSNGMPVLGLIALTGEKFK